MSEIFNGLKVVWIILMIIVLITGVYLIFFKKGDRGENSFKGSLFVLIGLINLSIFLRDIFVK